jgi:hypothetical protein
MSDIELRCRLYGVKNSATITVDRTVSLDIAGSGLYSDTQSIGTNWEQVTFPSDLTSEGIKRIQFVNADATNYIEFALDDQGTNKFAKLLKNEPMSFPPATGNPTIYARANTAACVLVKAATGT